MSEHLASDGATLNKKEHINFERYMALKLVVDFMTWATLLFFYMWILRLSPLMASSENYSPIETFVSFFFGSNVPGYHFNYARSYVMTFYAVSASFLILKLIFDRLTKEKLSFYLKKDSSLVKKTYFFNLAAILTLIVNMLFIGNYTVLTTSVALLLLYILLFKRILSYALVAFTVVATFSLSFHVQKAQTNQDFIYSFLNGSGAIQAQYLDEPVPFLFGSISDPCLREGVSTSVSSNPFLFGFKHNNCSYNQYKAEGDQLRFIDKLYLSTKRGNFFDISTFTNYAQSSIVSWPAEAKLLLFQDLYESQEKRLKDLKQVKGRQLPRFYNIIEVSSNVQTRTLFIHDRVKHLMTQGKLAEEAENTVVSLSQFDNIPLYDDIFKLAETVTAEPGEDFSVERFQTLKQRWEIQGPNI